MIMSVMLEGRNVASRKDASTDLVCVRCQCGGEVAQL